MNLWEKRCHEWICREFAQSSAIKATINDCHRRRCRLLWPDQSDEVAGAADFTSLRQILYPRPPTWNGIKERDAWPAPSYRRKTAMRHVEFPSTVMCSLHAGRRYKATTVSLHYSKLDAAANCPARGLHGQRIFLLITTYAHNGQAHR